LLERIFDFGVGVVIVMLSWNVILTTVTHACDRVMLVTVVTEKGFTHNLKLSIISSTVAFVMEQLQRIDIKLHKPIKRDDYN